MVEEEEALKVEEANEAEMEGYTVIETGIAAPQTTRIFLVVSRYNIVIRTVDVATFLGTARGKHPDTMMLRQSTIVSEALMHFVSPLQGNDGGRQN